MGTHPYIAEAEFRARHAALQARLREAGVAAALFDEIESMAWLTGYGNSENRWRCLVVPAAGAPFIVIRALDATPCRDRAWVSEIHAFRDWEDPMPVLAAALAARGLEGATIGLDFGSYGMPLRRFEALRAALPQARLVDLGPIVWEQRLVKSPAEVALLRRSAAVADEALARAAAACVPGASQRDAARIAMATFMEMGADPGPPGPITAGRGWDFLHGHLGDAPLAEGDIVHIELTPRIAWYSARIMRCVSVGQPDPALAKAAAALDELQRRQVSAMRPGMVAHEVDAILREGVLDAGLRPAFDNITGYTLGLYAPMGPRTSDFTRMLCPGAAWRLEPGMVFHVYASAAGASVSRTVLVTEDAPESLSATETALFVNA